MTDRWHTYVDGYAKGDLAVFPGLLGSWEVWQRVDAMSEWEPVEPAIYAQPTDGQSRDDVIAEAKKLADAYFESQWAGFQ